MNMNKITLAVASAAFCLAQGAIAAPGDFSARGAVTPDTTVPNANPAPLAIVVDQGFDDITTLAGAGWTLNNNSDGVGTTDWFQGNDTVFTAFDGATDAYIGANFNNTDGGGDGGSGIISNWMVTPPINFGTGATVSFYTRTTTGSIFPDRLQVRVCAAMPCANFGAAGEGTGDFATLLTDINAGEVAGGYPDTWTQFTLTNTDGLPTSGTGRVAFRYYVHNAGPAGASSNYIGIDRVAIEEGTAGAPAAPAIELPSLGTSAMIGLGALLALFGFAGLRRRRMN
ncbi:MAG TPA: choice-of-anchor J domain-containing protein [Dokdonella sp.]|uniref:choice-of-anchor J domain-containing protein n=1 Tax=Dokdonella sp. TaxID=2291710 RepID=UPI002D7F31C2|nr:choice-of-anchor J domain-containing protein [Dokdonella sp.]HET9034393.1 choice-of-anchor J domain-containing protein [Dokdonella sp.]